MRIKKILTALICIPFAIYILCFTGISESDLYGVYTNSYKNHKDTIWLYPNEKGCQKIYDKNNQIVYSYEFSWRFNYTIPSHFSTMSIDGLTLQHDIDFTDSLNAPAIVFEFEPEMYSNFEFGKKNDSIMIHPKCFTEENNDFSFYKISN